MRTVTILDILKAICCLQRRGIDNPLASAERLHALRLVRRKMSGHNAQRKAMETLLAKMSTK